MGAPVLAGEVGLEDLQRSPPAPSCHTGPLLYLGLLPEQAPAALHLSSCPAWALLDSSPPCWVLSVAGSAPDGVLCVSCSSPSPEQPFQPSCPDKNKVHFSPTGSAFCPVSLVKPLFPNVGFLFRGFPAPGSPGTGTFPSCQPPAPSPFLGARQEAVVDSLGEGPKPPSLGYEPWTRGQPEDTVVFHSSLVV